MTKFIKAPIEISRPKKLAENPSDGIAIFFSSMVTSGISISLSSGIKTSTPNFPSNIKRKDIEISQILLNDNLVDTPILIEYPTPASIFSWSDCKFGRSVLSFQLYPNFISAFGRFDLRRVDLIGRSLIF